MMHASFLIKLEKDQDIVLSLIKKARHTYQASDSKFVLNEGLGESYYLQAIFFMQLKVQEKRNTLRPSFHSR